MSKIILAVLAACVLSAGRVSAQSVSDVLTFLVTNQGVQTGSRRRSDAVINPQCWPRRLD